MDYERLKSFVMYDVQPQENHQFVMIKSLTIVQHLTRSTIAKSLSDENKHDQNTDFQKVSVFESLVKRGVVAESKGIYSLIGYENFSPEQKKMLVKLCKNRIEEMNNKNSTPLTYWKVSPGEKAHDWEKQKEHKVIAIGWKDTGDLKEKTPEQIDQLVKANYGQNAIVSCSEVRNFMSIKKGDVIVANKGKSKVMGIGHVVGDYQYRTGSEYPHTYTVEWIDTKERECSVQNGWGITVVKIEPDVFKTIISDTVKNISKIEMTEEFEDLIREFDKNPQSFDIDWKWKDKEKSNNEQEFVRKFPIDELENLEIDNYVQGKPDPTTNDTNRDTFCYILERGLDSSGSIPGFADKFGIYYDNKNRHDYAFTKDYLSSAEAFTATKHDIYSIVNAGRQFQTEKNWEKLSGVIDGIGHPIQSNVRSKLLAIYFPESFLAIHSRDKINVLLDFLEIPKTKLRKKLTLKQSKLLELKDSHPIMKEWNVYKYSVFLFNVVIPLAEKEEPDPIIDDDIDYSIKHLPTPTLDNLDELRKTIAEKILIQDEKLEEIIAALVMGKSVLLSGAVGTGKTHLAKILPQIAWKEYGGYYSMVYTGTSDWTTQNVIGGIIPKVDSDKNITYEIQKGCVSNTVSKNWKEETSSSNERAPFEARNIEDELQKFKGIWLIIDEFNRANIDKAFGQMFTALEYREMQIPTIDPNEPFEELIIPEDYRIIGTLNTADKHYLHSLSDALKRRFSIIEIPIPEYSQKDEELYFVISKAIENLDTDVKLILSTDGKFIRGGGDLDAENIVDTLYTLMSFVREIKPLGTALLISMLRFMIVNHSLKLVKKENWDSSLDSALVTSIIPQIEDLNYWTLKVIRAALCGNLESFFENDPEIKDDGYEKYKKDFQKSVACIRKIKDKKRNNIVKRFTDGRLGTNKTKKDDGTEIPDQDIEYLKIWDAENVGNKPKLPKFGMALNQIISEKGIDEEIEE
jgi:MoxR-like ATPase